MYYKNFKSFFNSVIGYSDLGWEQNLEKNNPPWLYHDMEKMLSSEVGYPALLQLLVAIPFLGYCANQEDKEHKKAGHGDDFKYFCKEYLAHINEEYVWKQKGKIIWDTMRNKLAHVYFTKNAITTKEDSHHLQVIENENGPYLFISIRNFWEDTKKAIAVLYNDLNKDSKRQAIFLKKLDLLDQWQWKLNKRLILTNPSKREVLNPDSSKLNIAVSGEEGPRFID